jgi:next-to-BRCA1 protein 1
LLGVPADVNVILERYSDSAGCYIHLDSDNQGVYKQLYRAGKAKSKLRIKASTVDSSVPPLTETSAEPVNQNPPRHSYLETVLSSPIPVGSTEILPATTASSPAPTAAFGESLPTGVYGRKELANTSEPQYRNFEMENDTLRFPLISHNSPSGMFCIDCNNCGRSIANEHFHCGICENGDYDLCPACVTNGALCRGEGHWLIKRSVENGIVTNSTTETIAPHQAQVQATKPLVSRPAQEPITETVAPVSAPAPTSAPLSHKDVAAQEEKPMCNGCCRGMLFSSPVYFHR